MWYDKTSIEPKLLNLSWQLVMSVIENTGKKQIKFVGDLLVSRRPEPFYSLLLSGA